MSPPSLTSQRLHPGLNLHETDPATHEHAQGVVFGFWVFLMSDAVLFALLFAVYASVGANTADGPAPADVFKLVPAALETLVLLLSSFTFGIASLAMKHARGVRLLQAMLAVTLLLGLGFLGLEAHDFLDMAREHALPQRSGFLSAFFALVPTHFLHVLLGCLWIVVMMVQAQLFGLDGRTKTRLLRLGLFWHFLDIVWVMIFTFVFLRGLL